MDRFAISFGSFCFGVFCLTLGAWQIYQPAGLITLGLVLVAFSLLPKIGRS